MGLKARVKRRDRRKAKASNWTRLPGSGSRNKVGHTIHAQSLGRVTYKLRGGVKEMRDFRGDLSPLTAPLLEFLKTGEETDR